MHIIPVCSEKHVQHPIHMILTTLFWLIILPRITIENPAPSVGIESIQITRKGSVARETAEGITASTTAPLHDKPEEPVQQQKNLEGLRQRTNRANSGEPTTYREPDVETQNSPRRGPKSLREKIGEKLEVFKSWCKRLLSYFASKPKRITTDYTKIQINNEKEKLKGWDRFSTWVSNILPSRREAARIKKDNEVARSWRDQKNSQEGDSPIANQQAGMQAPRTGHAAETTIAKIQKGNQKPPTQTSNSPVHPNGPRPLNQPTPAMARQRSQALASTFVDEFPNQEQRADALRRRTLQTLHSLNLPEPHDIPTTKLEYLPGFVQSSNIKGDGNCQFRAVSQLRYGTQEYHLWLRGQAVAWLRKHPDTVQSFMTAEAANPHIEQTLETQKGKPVSPQKGASSILQHGKPSSPPNREATQKPQNAKAVDANYNSFLPSSLQTKGKSKLKDGKLPSPATSKEISLPSEPSIVEQYCKYMEEPGAFGDDYTLFALAEVTKLDLVCVSATDAGHSISEFTKKTTQESHIWKGVYHQSQHYQLLLKDADFNKPTAKHTNARPPTVVQSSQGSMLTKKNYGLQVNPGHQDIASYHFKISRPSFIPTEQVAPGVVASKNLIEKSNESQFFVWQLFTHHSNDDKLAHSCRREAYEFLKERPDIFGKVEKLPQFQADWKKKFPDYSYNQERYLQLLWAGAISEDLLTLSALAELKKMKIVVYEHIGDKNPSTTEIIPAVVEDHGWVGLIKRVEEKYNDNYQLLYKVK